MNEKKTTRKRRQALESVPEAESVEASSSSQSNEKTSKRSNSGKSKIVESVEVSSSSQSNEKTSKRSNSDKSKISEAEVLSRLVPDCIADGLEILFVGINPGYYTALRQHHYGGPGNHFFSKRMTYENDQELPTHGIGLTNFCTRATRSSSDLTKNEMKAGAEEIRLKLQRIRPKIIAFNGKGIYETFSNRQKVTLGLQEEKFQDSYVFVMPSSSPRAASYPTLQHKLPFYVALRKLRDFLRGNLPELDFQQLKFPTGDSKSVKITTKSPYF